MTHLFNESAVIELLASFVEVGEICFACQRRSQGPCRCPLAALLVRRLDLLDKAALILRQQAKKPAA